MILPGCAVALSGDNLPSLRKYAGKDEEEHDQKGE